MREIRFRGMVKKGHWEYGGYFRHETRECCVIGDDKLADDEIKHVILRDSFADWNMPKTIEAVEVIPETVGQFTGLQDKNGLTDIYEGDIIGVDGLRKGNIYENPNLLEDSTNHVVKGMGTSKWQDAEQEAIKRGCKYAKRYGL